MTYYDIDTADGYAALNHLLTVIDMKLGYLSSDGITRTPKPGMIGWMVGGLYCVPAPPGIGETDRWTQLMIHPTQSGRYALLIDRFVLDAVSSEIARLSALVNPTAAQTKLLNTLNGLTMVSSLDNSWTASS